VAVETYTYELQLALVARERGLGLVPARILARSPLRSRLRVRRVPGLDFPLTIWAVRGRAAPELAPVFEALDRALIERLGGARLSLRSPSSSRVVAPSRTSRRTAPRHTAGGIRAR
jgi:DNA-binding transcriptional LysR family regulator